MEPWSIVKRHQYKCKQMFEDVVPLFDPNTSEDEEQFAIDDREGQLLIDDGGSEEDEPRVEGYFPQDEEEEHQEVADGPSAFDRAVKNVGYQNTTGHRPRYNDRGRHDVSTSHFARHFV